MVNKIFEETIVNYKEWESINKFYHEIDRKDSFVLYEHNLDGDEDAHIFS